MLREAQRLTAYGVAVRDGAILLARAGERSSLPGTWSLPGGGIEHGEDPADTVRREFAEETGLQVAVRSQPRVFSDVLDLVDEGTRLHTVRVVLPVVVLGGELTSEHAAWVPLSQALSLEPIAPFAAAIIKGAIADANSTATERPIRNVAVGLAVRDGHVLAEQWPLVDGHHRFVRAIGGGIAFGERAADAVVREFREELGVAVTGARLLAVVENLFEIVGVPGHEVVHVFAVTSPELERLPLGARVDVQDSDSWAAWYPIADLLADTPPFYPAGAAQLASALEG